MSKESIPKVGNMAGKITCTKTASRYCPLFWIWLTEIEQIFAFEMQETAQIPATKNTGHTEI